MVTEPETFKINGKEYKLANLSGEAKAQLTHTPVTRNQPRAIPAAHGRRNALMQG